LAFLRQAGSHRQFGNQILTLDELRERAERERRLRQPAPTPIGATRVQA
jgi:hypothetical protein